MIKKYTLQINTKDSVKQSRYGDWGYQFYGVLMDTLKNDEYGNELHMQESTPISQYAAQTGTGRGEWIVNLMGTSAIEQFSDRLDSLSSFHLNLPDVDISIVERKVETISSVREILDKAAQSFDVDRFIVSFRSSTSFKSEGEYAFFPTVAWIVKSLVAKWNATWTTSIIADDDAVAALIRGLRLSAYKLSSSFYPIKGIKIPGFIGDITLTARLPVPLLELLKPLLYFGCFSGVGIKCALGMGGMTALPSTRGR